MTQVDDAARTLIGQTDLYAALRAAGAGKPHADAGAFLAALIVALGRMGDDGRATAHRLGSVDARLLMAILRKGAGQAAVAGVDALRNHLAATSPAPLFQPDVAASATIALPTGGQRPEMPAFSDPAFDAWFAAKGVPYGLGSYGEHRTVYQTVQFADAASPERRTVHLGIDIFAPAGTPLFAPLSGRVAFVSYNADPLDYGHALILEHTFENGVFWTLYGHLGASLPQLCRVGQTVGAGQAIAHLGDWPENGGWSPHVHFQVMSSLLSQTGGNFFGVGHASLWDVWQDICPDPNLILRIPPDRFALA